MGSIFLLCRLNRHLDGFQELCYAIGMQAITIHQPFASAIAAGAKTIENRSWAPPARMVGEWVAIHASAQRHDHPLWPQFAPLWRPPWTLPRAAVVGIARLIAVHPPGVSDSPWAIPECWGWEFADARPVEPAPCTGALGFWRLPEGIYLG